MIESELGALFNGIAQGEPAMSGVDTSSPTAGAALACEGAGPVSRAPPYWLPPSP